MKSVVILVILLVFTHLKCSHGKKSDKKDYTKFLERYGYLGPAWDQGSNARADNIKSKALVKFQKYAQIPVSGRMDRRTVEMLSSPRCGAKDYRERVQTVVHGIGVTFSMPSRDTRRKKRYLKQGTSWDKKTLTYSIHGKTSPSASLTARDVERTLDGAFRQWQAVSTLTFRKLRNDRPADIKIMFSRDFHGDIYPFDGKGGTLAHGFYPVSIKGLEGDVHFDDDEVWTIKGETGTTDFTWTSLHEIGHSIGLKHSGKPTAIMWPWFRGYKPSLQLSTDDIDGIQSIYGRPILPVTNPQPIITAVRKPAICYQSNFDAVMYESKSRKTYFFKRPNVWTVNQNRYVEQRPERISSKWPGLPRYMNVNAAYTNKKGSMIFFQGSKFWEIKDGKMIRNLRLDKYITNAYDKDVKLYWIDAAMVWDHNGKTYFFQNDRYWRFNEKKGKIDAGYPRKIATWWPKVKIPVQAVSGWERSKTFFFSRDSVYRYNHKTKQAKFKKGKKNKISYFIKNCRK